MNHSISFFRFIFTLVIAFWHFAMLSKEWLKSGYIVVEFFFILSGFLLYQSSRKPIDTIEYTKNRLSKFWLKTVVITIIISLANGSIIFDCLNNFLQYSAEVLLLLVDVVPFDKNIQLDNGPIWYLTVLIWGGAFIYAIIKTFTKKQKLILAVICFVCYTIVLNHSYDLNDVWAYPLPLLRGLAGISLGCILNYIVNEHSNIIGKTLIDITSILGFVISTILLFITDVHGILPVICYSFIIIACFKQDSAISKMLNLPIFSKLASTSFEVFIGHIFVTKIVFKIMQFCYGSNISQTIDTTEKVIGSILYIITLFIFGYIYQKACNRAQKELNRIF